MATERMVTSIPVIPGAMQPAYAALDTSAWNDVVHGSIDTIRAEINDAREHSLTFYQLNPDEAMRLAGGYSARMGYIASLIKDIENEVPGWRPVREAALACQEEMRWQHENHSRLHTTREFEWKQEHER